MNERKIATVAKQLATPLKEALRLSAEMNAHGIQFNARSELRPLEISGTGRRQLIRQLENHRLKVSALEFLPTKTIYEPEHLEERIDAIKAAMQLSYDLKSKILVTRVGKIPEKEDPEFQTLIELLNDLSRTGTRVGCSLALLPSRNNPQDFLRLFERTDAGGIGLCYDPASFFLAGNDPVEAFQKLQNRIITLRVRDALFDVDGESQEVPLGRGEIAWDELMVLLEQLGYREWWTICRTQGSDRPGDVSRAISYLREISSG